MTKQSVSVRHGHLEAYRVQYNLHIHVLNSERDNGTEKKLKVGICLFSKFRNGRIFNISARRIKYVHKKPVVSTLKYKEQN